MYSLYLNIIFYILYRKKQVLFENNIFNDKYISKKINKIYYE